MPRLHLIRFEKTLTHLGLDLQPPPRGLAREAGRAWAQ